METDLTASLVQMQFYDRYTDLIITDGERTRLYPIKCV